MTFNIAFFSDQHLGYAAKVPSNEQGVNIRVQDGYDAFKEVVRGIIESDVKIDAVVNGGDFCHTSNPSVRSIAVGNHFLRLLAKAKIPFYGIGGNHDTSDVKADVPAVAAFNDPDRNIHMFHEAYNKIEIADGIMLHAMAHHGMHTHEAPDVKVSSDVVNLFTTHGAAIDPKNQTLLRCLDSPREQIIPVELITDGLFNASLLGHYHNRYAVGNSALNTWYSGSLLRRGFSDDPGPRGWLLVKVHPNGTVEVEPRDITQRPQFDLPPIDADGMSASDVLSLMEVNLEGTHDLAKAPIVRQRIINAHRSLRESLDQKHIKELRQHTLSWQLEFPRPAVTKKEKTLEASIANGRTVSIMDNYKRFTDDALNEIPEAYRDIVFNSAQKYLDDAQAITKD